MLVVSLDLMGDSVVSKWGRGGGIGYDPGEVYMGKGCMLCPCIMGGVTGTIAGTAHVLVIDVVEVSGLCVPFVSVGVVMCVAV